MRRPMIAGNWKMNTTLDEAVELVLTMREELDQLNNIDTLICPPFTSLSVISELLKEYSTKLGAQNVFYEEKGAYTGEISPVMLADLCDFVIIGHSERRQYFSETGETINKRIRASLKVGLKPILCIGETLKEKDDGRTKEILNTELASGLSGLDNIDMLLLAYEPIWAIGTGKAATSNEANNTIGIIRRNIADLYGEEVAQTTRILYGGSVNPDNTTQLMQQSEIDGALVGGASLRADQFLSIARQVVALY
ncbi:triose-phosphate isomerase [Chloroflexota bacterium]